MSGWWNDPTSKHAFILSWFSVILTAAAAITGIGFFMSLGSALCLVFGLENLVDLLSSIIVLWRFYCPGVMTKEREELLLKREERASMGISFILILLGIGVIATALDDLAGGPESEKDLQTVLYISLFSIFVFGTLTIFKFRYAEKLSSPSLYKDGICSLIGTCLAAALFVNTLIIDNNASVWWLDPVVSIIGGVVAFIIGVHALVIASCINKIPIFTVQWWFVSQGGEAAAATSSTEGGETEMQSQPAAAAAEEGDEKPLSDLV